MIHHNPTLPLVEEEWRIRSVIGHLVRCEGWWVELKLLVVLMVSCNQLEPADERAVTQLSLTSGKGFTPKICYI